MAPESLLIPHDPHVYFLQYGVGNPIKIGYTSHIGLRLAALSSSHWQQPTMLHVFPGSRETEQAIHSVLAQWRIGETEWFEPTHWVLRYANELASAYLSDRLLASVRMYQGVDFDDLPLVDFLISRISQGGSGGGFT